MTGSPPPSPPPLVLGVLGGIASGKSYVARALAGPSGRVIQADLLAHEALASPEGAAFVAERFGSEALGPDGLPDRTRLGRIAFESGDPEAGRAALRALEDWIHPRVRARILALLEEARAAGARPVVLDVPLLLENDAQHGLARACDVLIFVDTAAADREARAVERRGWSSGEVARREAAQLPLEEKRRRADHVLSNHGTLAELDAAIASLRNTLDLSD